MGRPARGWWDQRRECWVARLGPVSEVTGRPKVVPLTHPDGRPIDRDDRDGAGKAARRLVERRSGVGLVDSPSRVVDVSQGFLEWHAANGSAVRTVKDHYYHLGRFCRFTHGGVAYGDRPAASIGPEDLWRLKSAGLGSLRLLYASVLACWRWAARPVEGREPVRLLKENPLAGLRKPKRGPKVEKLVEWSTTRKLLRFARSWARQDGGTRRERTWAQRRLKVLCLDLVATTGCRPFEAAGLRW